MGFPSLKQTAEDLSGCHTPDPLPAGRAKNNWRRQTLAEGAAELAGGDPITGTDRTGKLPYEHGDTPDAADMSPKQLRQYITTCSSISDATREKLLEVLEQDKGPDKTPIERTAESLVYGVPSPPARRLTETRSLKEQAKQLREANAIHDMIADAHLTFDNRAARERFVNLLLPLSPQERKAEIQERASRQRR